MELSSFLAGSTCNFNVSFFKGKNGKSQSSCGPPAFSLTTLSNKELRVEYRIYYVFWCTFSEHFVKYFQFSLKFDTLFIFV